MRWFGFDVAVSEKCPPDEAVAAAFRVTDEGEIEVLSAVRVTGLSETEALSRALEATGE